MRAPPPLALMMISGRFCSVAHSINRVNRSPTTDPMLPMMNALSVTAKATRRARIMPVPVTDGIGQVRFVSARRPIDRRSLRRSANSSGSVGRRCSFIGSNVPSSRTCSDSLHAPKRKSDARTWDRRSAAAQPLSCKPKNHSRDTSATGPRERLASWAAPQASCFPAWIQMRSNRRWTFAVLWVPVG